MWTGNGNVTRQREGRELLPARFPAVCPCEAVCAAFPGWVASLPHPASKAALSRPVSRVYGGSRRTLEPLGRRECGGRFRCRIKSGGRAAPPARFTPSRNAGRDNGLRGFEPGVSAGVRFGARGSGLTPRGRNRPPFQDFSRFQAGVRQKIEEMEAIHAQRKNQVCTADHAGDTAACQKLLSAGQLTEPKRVHRESDPFLCGLYHQ